MILFSNGAHLHVAILSANKQYVLKILVFKVKLRKINTAKNNKCNSTV